MPIIVRVASGLHVPPCATTYASRTSSQTDSESISTPSRSNTTASIMRPVDQSALQQRGDRGAPRPPPEVKEPAMAEPQGALEDGRPRLPAALCDDARRILEAMLIATTVVAAEPEVSGFGAFGQK